MHPETEARIGLYRRIVGAQRVGIRALLQAADRNARTPAPPSVNDE